MALIKCKECGQEISSKADKCPGCGAKTPAKTSAFTWLVLIVILVSAYAMFQGSTNSTPGSSGSATSSTSSAESSVVAKPTWTTFTSKDEVTGKSSAYATSPTVGPKEQMDFPYNNVEAWLGVGCDGSSEWAYVGFSSAPNLTGTQTEDGYNDLTTRIRWDDRVEYAEFTQQWNDKFLHFSKGASAIRNMSDSKSVLLELQWYGQQPAYFNFPLDGSSNAIHQMRARCSKYGQ